MIPMQITEEAGRDRGGCDIQVSYLETLLPLMAHLTSHVVVERVPGRWRKGVAMGRKSGRSEFELSLFLVQAAVILHI